MLIKVCSPPPSPPNVMKNGNIMKFMLPMSWGISHTHTNARTHTHTHTHTHTLVHTHACTFWNAFLGIMHWWNINKPLDAPKLVTLCTTESNMYHPTQQTMIKFPIPSKVSLVTVVYVASDLWYCTHTTRPHTYHHHHTPLPHTCTSTLHTHHHHLPNTPPHAHTFRNVLLGIKQFGNAGKMMHTHTFCLFVYHGSVKVTSRWYLCARKSP